MKISIIIPVINEAAIINQMLKSLKYLYFDGEFEILVVDGKPSPNTLDAITDQNIIKILSPKGRASQMNAGARHASGQILLFLHADTFLPPQSFDLIIHALNTPKILAGAFDLKIDSPRFVFRVIEKTASFRSRLTRLPYGDQAIFIRRNFFMNLGGFPDIPLMEDIALMRQIKQTRKKIVLLPAKVRTSARRWEKQGVIYTTLRNWILLTLYFMGVCPKKLARFYE